MGHLKKGGTGFSRCFRAFFALVHVWGDGGGCSYMGRQVTGFWEGVSGLFGGKGHLSK